MKLRGWPAIIVFLLLLATPFIVFAFSCLSRPAPPPTWDDLAEEHHRLESGASLEDRLNLAVAYGGFVQRVGAIIESHEATVAMLDENPDFANKPEIIDKRKKMDQALAKFLQSHKLDDLNEWRFALEGAGRFTSLLLAEPLTPQQRLAVIVVNGRCQFFRNEHALSLKSADEALKIDRGSVTASLLRADSLVELRRYQDAIEQFRATNLMLTAWAERDPDWELRLAWSVSGPIRSSHSRSKWREHRRKIAADISSVISTEVSVLRGLQNLDSKLSNN